MRGFGHPRKPDLGTCEVNEKWFHAHWGSLGDIIAVDNGTEWKALKGRIMIETTQGGVKYPSNSGGTAVFD